MKDRSQNMGVDYKLIEIVEKIGEPIDMPTQDYLKEAMSALAPLTEICENENAHAGPRNQHSIMNNNRFVGLEESYFVAEPDGKACQVQNRVSFGEGKRGTTVIYAGDTEPQIMGAFRDFYGSRGVETSDTFRRE